MSRNYRISEHPFYHAARCAKRAMAAMARKTWSHFLYPVVLVACGVTVGVQLARMFGSVLGTVWR